MNKVLFLNQLLLIILYIYNGQRMSQILKNINDENSLEKLFSNEFISYDEESALSINLKAATLVNEEKPFFIFKKKKATHIK